MRSAAAAGRADRRRLRLTLDLPAATAATGRGAGSQHQIYWVCPHEYKRLVLHTPSACVRRPITFDTCSLSIICSELRLVLSVSNASEA